MVYTDKEKKIIFNELNRLLNDPNSSKKNVELIKNSFLKFKYMYNKLEDEWYNIAQFFIKVLKKTEINKNKQK